MDVATMPVFTTDDVLKAVDLLRDRLGAMSTSVRAEQSEQDTEATYEAVKKSTLLQQQASAHAATGVAGAIAGLNIGIRLGLAIAELQAKQVVN